MSKELDLPGPPVTFYSLFRLIDTSGASLPVDRSPHSSMGSAGFGSIGASASLELSSDGVDLEVVTTDMHEAWEKQLKLKKAILGKVTKNMTYESGSIILLPNLVSKNKVFPPTKCYWTLLKDKDNKKYILCLISVSEAEGFNLFRYDLEKYAKKIESECLMTQGAATPEAKNALVVLLANWQNVTIDYLARAALLLSDELDILIHSCLMGHKIEVKTTMPSHGPLAEDVIRLIDAVQLPNHTVDNDAARTDVVTVTFDHAGKPQVDSNETNEFCREWAARLIQGGSNRAIEAIVLRSWTEVVKMQITQELNHVRKLTEAAVIDNYALYEAFLYLKNNPNKDVLLVLLMKEVAVNSNLKIVLHTIFKCLTTPMWPISSTTSDDIQDERTVQPDILT